MKKNNMHDVILLNLSLGNSENASLKLSLACKNGIFQVPVSQFRKCISRFVIELIIQKNPSWDGHENASLDCVLGKWDKTQLERVQYNQSAFENAFLETEKYFRISLECFSTTQSGIRNFQNLWIACVCWILWVGFRFTKNQIILNDFSFLKNMLTY